MPPPIATDRRFMQQALNLAEATVGLASPNPQVGCVLVRDGEILGAGAHLYDQRDHAEIVALKQAAACGRQVQGATAYVTLEPCSHHGRTGPCAEALVAAGIGRCVVATADPNPLVSGQGLAKLHDGGVEVMLGVCEREAQRMNEAFARSIASGRPFLTLKAGLSIDGRLAPPPELRTRTAPYWLTGPESRAEVQRMRHASDAILTGIGTVLADDPLLTDRSSLPRRRSLMRVVLDSQLCVPLSSTLVRSVRDDLWIFCSQNADIVREQALNHCGVRVTRVGLGVHGLHIHEVLAHLQVAKLLSVLVEGGSTLNAVLLQDNLVDRITFFYAPTELGHHAIPFAGGGPTSFQIEERLRSVTKTPFGEDVCVSGLLEDPWARQSASGLAALL